MYVVVKGPTVFMIIALLTDICSTLSGLKYVPLPRWHIRGEYQLFVFSTNHPNPYASFGQ